MATRFIVDASAMVKSFVPSEVHASALVAWVDKVRKDGHDLLAPFLLRYELGQVLTRATAGATATPLEPVTRRKILDETLVGLRFADSDTIEHHAPPLTYYDGAYLALAKANGAVLVTYDKELAAAARKAGVEVVAPGE